VAESVEIIGAIEPVEREWEELAERVGASPFVRPGWVSAWWEAFGSGSLAVFALRRDGRLASVLPLVRHRGALRSPTNWHTPGFGVVAEDDAAKLALFEAVVAEGPRRVDLSFLGDAADVQCLRQAAAHHRLVERVVIRSPYVPVESDWDSYWRGLSRNLRKTVRRCRNRLAERGEMTIEVVDGRKDLDRLLEEGFRLEASGWKGEEVTAIASRPETRRFYKTVSRWAADAGILCLAFMRIDGEAVAFNLSFEAGGHHYVLKLGHDAELNSLGPGTVLTATAVERTFALGLKSYEFLGGDTAYKLRWAPNCHELARVQAFAPTASGAVDRLIQTSGRDIAKKLLRRDGRG
jgi:CelD/BcsL family acetyltransferase involved in cellulose biosynthesis